MWRTAFSKKLNQGGLSALIGLGGLTLTVTGVLAYYQYTTTHLPPNVYINSIPVGNLTYPEALEQLKTQTPDPPQSQVTLRVDDITIASSSAELGLHYDYDEVLASFEKTATQGRLRDQLKWRLRPLFSSLSTEVKPHYEQEKLTQFISQLNQKVAYQGIEPSVTLKRSGNPNSLEIFPGKHGREINSASTQDMLQNTKPSSDQEFSAIVASTAAELSEEDIKGIAERAGKFVDKSIYFQNENRDYFFSDTELVSFLKIPTGYDVGIIETKVATLAAQINREPQEPVFEYNKETLKVIKFSPPLNGQSLDQAATKQQILDSLAQLEQATASATKEQEVDQSKPLQLAVATTPPKQSLAQTNDLGIAERIGFGDSHYNHSIANRIHNVAITTQRITDVIVPPGAEFSFNKTLGDVSAATGYRSAYVIRNGQTELGDGGGVCQVSTTLFRSVLDAGLKVTRRIPHSYRVSYYELDTKPGVDATVYAGETDFRFINDTGHYLLIHGNADSKDLYMYMEIYGTSDGRTTEIKDHITWNPRPAPAPQYFPDPSLPPGKLVQIDWAASGISASFVNVIKDKEGKIIREDKYVSNYKPWSAKYRQGVAQ